MKSLFAKLWADDAGIVALEYLLVATIVGLGLIVGLATLEGALKVELAELADAILALNQGYSIAGEQGYVSGNGVANTIVATKTGSAATDLNGDAGITYVNDATPKVINGTP